MLALHFAMAGGVALVASRGSGVYLWMGLQLRSIGFLGLLLVEARRHWTGAAMYFVARAVAGGLIYWGRKGDNIHCLWVGIVLKLGVPPLHVWVRGVARVLSTPGLLFSFLFTVKLGPIWVAGWVGPPHGWGTQLIFSILAIAGAMLGLPAARAWPTKIALASTGLGSWALVASTVAWWAGPSFFLLYGAAVGPWLYDIADDGGELPLRVPLGVKGTLPFAIVAGMPPGSLFWAKYYVVQDVLQDVLACPAGLPAWLPAFFLALSEPVSWAVYLSVLSGSRTEHNLPQIGRWGLLLLQAVILGALHIVR